MATVPAGYIFHNGFWYGPDGTGPYYINATGTAIPVNGVVLLTPTEISSPSAAVLADKTATYQNSVTGERLKVNAAGTGLEPITNSDAGPMTVVGQDVQAGLNTARTANRKLVLASKVYASNTGLTINMGTEVDGALIVEGAGYHASPLLGGSCLHHTGTTGAALSLVGSLADNQDGSIELRNFAVHGASTTAGNTPGARGIHAKVLSGALLHNLFSGHHGGDGLYGDLCFSAEVTRGLYFYNFGNGLNFVNAANRVRLAHIIAFGNGRDPTTIDQANIFIFGSSNPAFAPELTTCDVSYAGRKLFSWAGKGGEVANISSLTVAGGVATVTTSAAHGLSTGNKIASKFGVTAGLRSGNVGATVTVTGTTTFTFPVSAANGTYTSATDPELVIGTHSNGISLFGTYGAKISAPYCEYPMGNGIYLYFDNRATVISGGFMLEAKIVVDGAQECEIGGVRFQGAGAGVDITEANDRATVNLKRSSCSFADGATITRGAYYMEDGARYGPATPTTGTWVRGERLFNSLPAVASPKSWVCTVGGTPGTFVSEGNL